MIKTFYIKESNTSYLSVFLQPTYKIEGKELEIFILPFVQQGQNQNINKICGTSEINKWHFVKYNQRNWNLKLVNLQWFSSSKHYKHNKFLTISQSLECAPWEDW